MKEHAADSSERQAVSWALAMCAYEWSPRNPYRAYRSARAQAEQALADWRAARGGCKRDAFAVYRAAADREDAAALTWMRRRALAPAGGRDPRGDGRMVAHPPTGDVDVRTISL